jgi:hypothetical protein
MITRCIPLVTNLSLRKRRPVLARQPGFAPDSGRELRLRESRTPGAGKIGSHRMRSAGSAGQLAVRGDTSLAIDGAARCAAEPCRQFCTMALSCVTQFARPEGPLCNHCRSSDRFHHAKLRRLEIAMSEPWPFKDWKALTEALPAIPLLLTGFAFAYVVGYFLAFDLAWLPFFSLSEHIVFAIRAIPVAVAASVILLVAMEHPSLVAKAMRVWIYVLWTSALIALIFRYVGLTVTFAIIAVATYEYNQKHPQRDSKNASEKTNHNDKAQQATALPMPFLAAQILVLSLLIGFFSGAATKFDSVLNPFIPSYLSRAMHVHLKPQEGGDKYIGHVVFVGSERVFIYQYDISGKTTNNKAMIIPWDKIDEIHEYDTVDRLD